MESGGGNTLIGYKAGDRLVDTSSNTILGAGAFGQSTNGHDNVVIGSAAGDDATDIGLAVIIGGGAGSGALTNAADGSVLIGASAGSAITSGTGNVAIGYQSLLQHTTGVRNTAIGYQAMVDTGGEPSSTDNVMIGYRAGAGDWGTATSNYNVGIGNYVMDSVLAGANSNTAIGYNALSQVTSGDNCVAIGANALTYCTEGIENVCIGYATGDAIVSGNNNTFVGYNCDIDANTARSDSILIGKDLTTYAANSYARLGNDTNYVELNFGTSGEGWANTSDKRVKQNIVDGDLGLEFINKLRPIKYEDKPSAEWDDELKSKIKEENLTTKSDGIRKEGFIAQEVKKVADDLGTTFSGWHGHPTDTSEKQMLEYAKFVIPLVKAVQELSAKVEELESKLK